jgi:ABC-2 type transport system ATP-binding protein
MPSPRRLVGPVDPLCRGGLVGSPGDPISSARSAADAGTRPASDTAPLLMVSEVTKSFRHGLWPVGARVQILRGTSLEVRPGELVGLVGENGSGKSTLMQIIVGLLKRDGGSVELRGALGYCPQLPELWDKLTVAEHLRMFAAAYRLNEETAKASTDRLVEELGFRRYLDYRIDALSGGTRQKLNLALALLHEPKVLLLDEPYAGFDWETYLRFWEMSAARRADGMAILVVSHLLGERERLDRIYTLKDGRCIPS